MRLSILLSSAVLWLTLNVPMSAQTTGAAPERISASLQFQIIEADGFTTADPQIREVEKALRDLFKFRGYRLAAEAYMRVIPRTKFSQVVTSTRDTTKYYINGQFGEADQKSAAIHVELYVGQFVKAIDTTVSVPYGQTVVVGTARPDASRAALILVVKPTKN